MGLLVTPLPLLGEADFGFMCCVPSIPPRRALLFLGQYHWGLPNQENEGIVKTQSHAGCFISEKSSQRNKSYSLDYFKWWESEPSLGYPTPLLKLNDSHLECKILHNASDQCGRRQASFVQKQEINQLSVSCY